MKRCSGFKNCCCSKKNQRADTDSWRGFKNCCLQKNQRADVGEEPLLCFVKIGVLLTEK